MPVIQGTITDVGGANPTGWLNIRALEPRLSEEGTATVGTALFPIRVTDGVITPTDVDPGPCVIQVTVGTWTHRYENINVPETGPVDFWDLVEMVTVYTPAVVSQVYQDRIATEEARDEAVTAAESVSDIQTQVDAVDADRVAAETAAANAATSESNASDSESNAATSETNAAASAGTASTAATNAQTAETGAQAAQTAAETARTGAETAETNAGTSETNAATSEANAAQSAIDAAASADEAADVVASGVPSADATTKGGIILAGDLGGTFDAPTVPELADKAELVHTHAISSIVGLQTALDTKLDQTQVDTTVEAKYAELVDSAPTTLDTLNELAAALGDDPNFATTVSAEIGTKADIGHTHSISDVTGLQTELDNRLESEVVASLPGTPVTGRIYLIPE